MKKKTVYIIGGIILLAGVGYFLYDRNRKKQALKMAQEDTELEDEVLSKSMGELSGEPEVMEDDRYNHPINPRLNWIENKKVASYLSSKLSTKDMTSLYGWVNLIKKERKANPKKWKEANNLKGQVADIGHALYQMKVQKQCSQKGLCWNATMLVDLQQAQ